MKKLISWAFIICTLFLLTSCNSNSVWQKAERTYSQFGVKVSFDYPQGYKIKAWDETMSMGIYAGDVEETYNWSVTMDVRQNNYTEFLDYKAELSKTASDIKQEEDIWVFSYTQPYKTTFLIKYFENGNMLVMQKANEFDYDDAFEIARTFEINVWGEDIK